MKAFVVKVFEFIAVIVGLMIGGFAAKNIGLESILRGKEKPVSLAQAEEGLAEDSVGMLAGADIPRIENAQEWEDTWWDISCITLEPTDIVSTGIAARHTWVSPYWNSRKRGRRKRPEVYYAVCDVFNEYGEYVLLQLPDQSYIMAQIPVEYIWKIKLGQEVTLPIGIKHAANSQVLSRIRDLCKEYQVNTDEGIFYCFNDQWNEEHNMILLSIRFIIMFVIMFLFSTIFITILHKVFRMKE